MVERWADWLKRARSNLKLAKVKSDEICFEDLCFEAQQAAEKALKALLVKLEIKTPRIHSFHVLLEEIEKIIKIPVEIEDVLKLSDYAVQTRYPGDYTPVSEDEYKEAVAIAERVIAWVGNLIK